MYHKWVGFVTAAISMSIFQAAMVYIISIQKDKLLALGGNTGNVIYDVNSCLFALQLIQSRLTTPRVVVLHWSRIESFDWIF